MIKPGDRVTLFSDMRVKGTVVSLERSKSQQWLVGGAADVKTSAKVKFDDGNEVVLSIDLLMPLHE